jgi:type IV secretory pathway TrbL component
MEMEMFSFLCGLFVYVGLFAFLLIWSFILNAFEEKETQKP